MTSIFTDSSAVRIEGKIFFAETVLKPVTGGKPAQVSREASEDEFQPFD